jgi:peptidoglycan-N-acetylglucosamine deacetylase
MSRPRRPLVVRLGEVLYSSPVGGEFAGKVIAPVPIPRVISGMLGVFCLDTTDRVVGLTYDDGPHPEHTPRILDALAAHGARATFFVLSGPAERHPDIIRRIVAEGHELALHGDDHRSLLTKTTGEAVAGVRRARAIVERIGGVRIRSYRPPYGRATLAQMARIRLLGLDVVMWSSTAHDWLHDEHAEIARRGLEGVFPGGIVLLHDDRGDPETLLADQVAPTFDRGAVADVMVGSLAEHDYRMLTVRQLFAGYRQVRSANRQEMSLG